MIDCPTRWNSTLLMIERLLEIRFHVETLFTDNKWDSLVPSQWTRLENLATLLQPFAQHTNLLQSDAMSLSNVVPAILDLECHLEQTTEYKGIAQVMLQSLQRRCAKVLDPTKQDFELIPSAACLADPTVAKCLITPAPAHKSRMHLLHTAARQYLIQCCQHQLLQQHNEHRDAEVSQSALPSESPQADNQSTDTDYSNIQFCNYTINTKSAISTV